MLKIILGQIGKHHVGCKGTLAADADTLIGLTTRDDAKQVLCDLMLVPKRNEDPVIKRDAQHVLNERKSDDDAVNPEEQTHTHTHTHTCASSTRPALKGSQPLVRGFRGSQGDSTLLTLQK